MSTAELPAVQTAPFTIAPITYDVQKEMIAKLADEYLPLVVGGVDDKEGLKLVHDARMHVKKLRLSIEARRKQLKSESLEYGKKVDSAAKELTALLEPIESHLEHEEQIVQREKERIAKEAAEKKQVITRKRLAALQAAGATYLECDIADLSDEDFAELLASEVADKRKRDEQAAAEKAERERVAEEQRLESERLAKEKAELERQRQEQEAEQAKIDAEKKRIADAEAEATRAAELEQAAEKARLEEIARQEREAAEAKAKADAAEAERKRVESLRPDHEKLLAVAEAVDAITWADLSPDAFPAGDIVVQILEECADRIREVANKLVRASETA